MKTQVQIRKSSNISGKLIFTAFILIWIAILFLMMTNVQAQSTDTIVQADTVKTIESNVQAQVPDTAKLVVASHTSPLQCRQEFSVWVAGGISALNYRPTIGERNLGLGGALGMGYTVYFHKNWGIHSGLELALYNTSYRLKNLKDMYTRTGFDDLTPDWTGENELIDYHTELSNYREKQQQYNINIPLMLQFQMPLANGNHQFFAMVGAKLGMQLKSFYNVNTELYTWYYDYKSNQEFRPDPADYGNPWLEDLGCFYNLNYSTKQKNQFKMAGLATAEMGIKWQLNPKLSLYTGIYVDYGFNNISKQNDNRFFEFDPVGVRMNSNSVLTSQYAHNGGDVKSFTDKVVPVSFGIKIRMGINMCKSEKRRKPEDVYIHVRDTIQNIIHDTVLKIDTVIELTEPMIKQVESVVKQTEPIVEYVEPKISKDTPVIQQPIHEQLKKLDPSEPQEQPQQVKSQVQHQQTTQSPATIELPVVSASDPDLRYRVQIMATLKQVKNYRQVVAELLQAMPQLKLEVLFDANNDGFYRYVTEPYLTHTEAEIIHAKIKELHIKSKIWTNQQAFISTYKGNDRVRIEL